ncbi:MAG: hypothetical protein WC851_04335 [Candidatus Shapirobacteria bacterium]|jgi:hypothetical protein
MVKRKDLGIRFNEILSNESIRPLEPKDIDISYIRRSLKEGGIRTDLSAEALKSLAKKPFLTFSDPKGRGFGLKEAIGSDRVVPLLNLTYELMDPSRVLEDGNDKSPARGMRQWVADLVELAAQAEPTPEQIQEFCDRTNYRVAKGYDGDHRPLSFRAVPKPEGSVASVPPDSIPILWNFLTTPFKK